MAFGSGAPQPNLTKPEPASLQEGSTWLATHLPGKFQEREIKTSINSLTLNDRKTRELQDWLKQVETWLEAQTDEGFINRIRRAAVIWGVPPGTVTKLHVHGKMTAGGPTPEQSALRPEANAASRNTFRRLVGGLAAEILHHDFSSFCLAQWCSGTDRYT